jgi:hypothetical protein
MGVTRMNRALKQVHVRKHSHFRPTEKAYCGRKNVSTVSSAWGFWGPGGLGYEMICKQCERLEKKKYG